MARPTYELTRILGHVVAPSFPIALHRPDLFRNTCYRQPPNSSRVVAFFHQAEDLPNFTERPRGSFCISISPDRRLHRMSDVVHYEIVAIAPTASSRSDSRKP